MTRFHLSSVLAVSALFAFAPLALPAQAADATIYAAASLSDVMDALAAGFERESGDTLTIVPGSSSTLAKQIAAGAPVDLFISANKTYADTVAAQLGAEGRNLFGNSLVLIAPGGTSGTITLDALPGALGDQRLAVGDTAHVPAGIYAKEALENAGLWSALEDHLAPAGDVRGAVAFVVNQSAPFGIVYKTDAAVPGVRIAGEIDPALHTPVRYWGVLTNKDSATAAAFLAYMQSDEGQGLLDDGGFSQ